MPRTRVTLKLEIRRVISRYLNSGKFDFVVFNSYFFQHFNITDYLSNTNYMNSSSHNKFSKSVSQFYLSKSSQQPLIKVDESGFMHRSSQFRLRKVNEMRQKLGARREKSLINYNRLSQILQTEERIFRSSSCFRNPYKFCLDESSKHLSTLLKSHILSREFYEAKKSKMVPK